MENRAIQRLCQSCRNKFNREDLIKITKINENILKLNPTSKEIGRSLYVCKNIECIKNLIKKKRIRSALKFNNQAEIERIEKELSDLFKKDN